MQWKSSDTRGTKDTAVQDAFTVQVVRHLPDMQNEELTS